MKRVFAVAVMIVLIAGCRVPDDSSPREIPASQVPFDLLTPSTSAPPATSPVPTVDGNVFMVSGDRLVAVPRSVPAPLSLGSLLAGLVQGPTRGELSRGYSTAVGPQASVLSAQMVDSSAVIEISDSFAGIGLQQQILGLAQIVFTASEFPGVQDVRIQINSQPATVPRGDGSVTSDPLTRSDYAALAPA